MRSISKETKKTSDTDLGTHDIPSNPTASAGNLPHRLDQRSTQPPGPSEVFAEVDKDLYDGQLRSSPAVSATADPSLRSIPDPMASSRSSFSTSRAGVARPAFINLLDPGLKRIHDNLLSI